MSITEIVLKVSEDVDEPRMAVKPLEKIRRDKALRSLREHRPRSAEVDKLATEEPVVRMKPIVKMKPIIQKVTIGKISPPKKDRLAKKEVQTYMPPALRNKGSLFVIKVQKY